MNWTKTVEDEEGAVSSSLQERLTQIFGSNPFFIKIPFALIVSLNEDGLFGVIAGYTSPWLQEISKTVSLLCVEFVLFVSQN